MVIFNFKYMEKYLFIILFSCFVNGIMAQNISYDYDSLGRVVQVVYPDSSIIIYTYDASGNRMSKNVTKSTITFACPQDIVSFYAGLSDTTKNYQWQADMGSGFNNINNNANYSGTTAATLQLINIPSSWNGFKYRCIFDGNFSETTLLKFINVWTGAVDSNWENPSNWSCGTIPDNYTDVIINNGIVFINSNVVIRSLIINPPGSLTVMSGNTLTITN